MTQQAPSAFLVEKGCLVGGDSASCGDGIRLVAVGDLQLSARVGRAILEHGPKWPFGETLPLLAGADVRLGQLEFFFTRERRGAMPGSEDFTAALPEAADALSAAGFDLLSIASNHSADWGPEGIETTRQILAEKGIAFAGAGLNEAEANQSAIVERCGRRIGLLAYCKAGAFSARGDRLGSAEIRRQTVLPAVARLKEQVDWVLVSLHWGVEYCPSPLPEDRRLAREIIEAGAAAVIGHHPHVVQGIEVYRGAPIFYSVGSFLYNPLDERVVDEKTLELRRHSLLVEMILQPGGVAGFRAIPTRFAEDGRLTVLRGETAERACAHVEKLSQEIERGWLAFSETAVGNLLS
ncbi:MAG: CapA family protein, partial [Candidatus Sumerlaeia bacterium]|nr:CapA family protein [Candidatus Sumerlaeia bacterium]